MDKLQSYGYLFKDSQFGPVVALSKKIAAEQRRRAQKMFPTSSSSGGDPPVGTCLAEKVTRVDGMEACFDDVNVVPVVKARKARSSKKNGGKNSGKSSSKDAAPGLDWLDD